MFRYILHYGHAYLCCPWRARLLLVASLEELDDQRSPRSNSCSRSGGLNEQLGIADYSLDTDFATISLG
jgi:hypothetical protein